MASGHRYLGVDISAEQLRHARTLVPEGEFRCADIAKVAFDAESFEAVVSLYVFGHLPRAALPVVLERIDGLRPGGYPLATFGRSGSEGVQDGWLGVPMFFGSCTDEDTLALLEGAGFRVERRRSSRSSSPRGRRRSSGALAARGRAAQVCR